MKDGSEEKMMPLFWLHWLHAPSLTLTLITDTWVAIPSYVLM